MTKVQIKFVKDAMDDPSPLSEYEYDFIMSISEKGDKYILSQKQNALLNRISQKYV